MPGSAPIWLRSIRSGWRAYWNRWPQASDVVAPPGLPRPRCRNLLQRNVELQRRVRDARTDERVELLREPHVVGLVVALDEQGRRPERDAERRLREVVRELL